MVEFQFLFRDERERERNNYAKLFYIGDQLLIGTGVGQLLVYDIKEPLGKNILEALDLKRAYRK